MSNYENVRKKLIYIESFAKVTSPTLTGKLLYKYADQFYVQWESMKEFYPKSTLPWWYILRRESNMIFVTLGSQKFQFNRLLQKIDELVKEEAIKEEIFAQIGYSDYKPENYQYKDFLNRNEFSEIQSKADVVITHGGTGAIIGAVKKGKKVLAVPRLAKYGEHVDDHQIQLLQQFDGMEIIEACYELDDFEKALKKLHETEYRKYETNTKKIIDSIEDYLRSELK